MTTASPSSAALSTAAQTEKGTPIHPEPTDEAGIEQAVTAALTAVAGAADLDALKAVRLAHAGDRSPLALTNRALADLPKTERAAPGRLIGQSRRRVADAIAAREAELVAERDARVLREETVDVTPAATTGSRPGRVIPSPRSWPASRTSSSRWAGRWPPVPNSRPNGSTSTP